MLKNTINNLKKLKSVKQSEIITNQPTIFEKPNIIVIKLVITEHPKLLQKLPKTIKKAEKVGRDRSLYSDTKKVETF